MDPLMYDVPDEIRTERLHLRVPRAGDGARICPGVRASMAELKQWMPWAKTDYAEADAELWCRKSFFEFHARKSIQLLMLCDDEHVGTLGAFDFDFAARSCEIGYWLRTDCVGNGYMSEAVLALGELASKTLKFHRIRIRCDPRNTRSAAVARRCYYALDGTMRHDALDCEGKPRDTHVFSRLYDPA